MKDDDVILTPGLKRAIRILLWLFFIYVIIKIISYIFSYILGYYLADFFYDAIINIL